MNKGEIDEILCILRLVEMRQKRIPFFSQIINSIKSNGIELNNLPNSICLAELNDKSKLVEISNFCKIQKSSPGSKSDVQVNGLGYSIKSTRSAPPAIVNHTARPGFVNVCDRIGVSIEELDIIINDYWKKRQDGLIREDVKNSHEHSPFKNHKNYLRPILNYFLFVGTGQKDSPYPAESIISFDDPLENNKWTLFNKENTLDYFWDKLVFSLRSKKGMPTGYPNKMSKIALKNKSSVDKWTEFIDGDYRGALHIRLSR